MSLIDSIMTFIEKIYDNNDLNVELTADIDNKQSIWFKGK